MKCERTADYKNCPKEFSFCGGTSNFWDHLFWAHEKIYQPNKDSETNTNKTKGKVEAFGHKTTCSVILENKMTQMIADFVGRIQESCSGGGGKRSLNNLDPHLLQISAQVYLLSSTAHFIIDNWELHSWVLQTLYFPESHTGELIAEKLKEIYVHFSLPLEKVVAVVHDLGCSMREVLHNDSVWASVECAATYPPAVCKGRIWDSEHC